MMSRKSGKTWTLILLASALGYQPLSWADPAAGQTAVTGTTGATGVTGSTGAAAQTPTPPPPAPAPVAPSINFSGSVVANYNHDLNASQFREVTNNSLSIETVHQDPNDSSSPITSVNLRGMMYDQCTQYFTISNSGNDATIKSSDGSFGFKITDNTDPKTGLNGTQCVSQAKAYEAANHVHLNKVTLARAFGDAVSMDVTGIQNDGKIGIVSMTDGADPSDPNALQFTSVGSQAINFQTATTLQTLANQKKQEAKEARVEENQDRFQNCRDTLDNLKIAYRAITQLHKDLGEAFDYSTAKKELDKAKKDLLAKQKKQELADLRSQIKKIKNADDALTLSDQLTQFAQDNPDFANTVANDQMNLAKHMTELSDANGDDYAAAQQIAENAADMDGVSDADAAKYKALGRSYQIEGMAAQAQAGVLDLSNAAPAYYGLANSIQRDEASDCRATQGQTNISPACAQSILNQRELPTLQSAIARDSMQAQQSQYYGVLGYGMQNAPLSSGLNNFNNGMASGTWGAGVAPTANNGGWGTSNPSLIGNGATNGAWGAAPAAMYSTRGF